MSGLGEVDRTGTAASLGAWDETGATKAEAAVGAGEPNVARTSSRAAPRRGAVDPVKALMHRHRELCERAVDPLEIAAGLLTVRGKKEEDKETKEKDYYRRERACGSFRRSIEIPAAVDASRIDASFKKGVLTINLPKTKEAQDKVKHIQVTAA